jgi:hypothetical protein
VNLVAHHRAKYLQGKYDARRLAAEAARQRYGTNVQISEWSNRSFEAIKAQWIGEKRDPTFDWQEIYRRYREPDQLDFAIWVGDRLCAMGLGLIRSDYIELAFLESDPRADCPLRGKRIVIALDAVANYVQACGRIEIRVEPANAKLVQVYQTVYEFELVSPRKGKPYCRKRI